MSDLKSKIVIVGFGQCGNQITHNFEQLNYNTYYVNSSISDFPEGISDDRKYWIDGAKGCAKDRQKAIEYGVGSFDDIIDKINARYALASIHIYIFSGGGGTGAGLTPLILDIASTKNPDKKYCAVMVLPHNDESLLSQDNAKESLKQLVEIQEKLYSIHLLSNNKREDFLEINNEFAILFDGIVDHKTVSEKGNIDDEEIEELITDQGFTTILEFENDDFKMGFNKAVSESIYADWSKDSHYIGMILNDHHKKSEALKETENEFGVPLTDFTTFTNEGNKVIATGMSFNKAILRDLNNTVKEKLQKKQDLEAQNEENDDEEVEEVSLSALRNKKKPIKKKTNSNVTKELDSILNKYKNM